jgi:DGQHR domain-containing protein
MTFTSGYIEFLGIQRKLDRRRVDEIARFVRTVDACFPNSIVISVDAKCVTASHQGSLLLLEFNDYVDEEDPSLSISLDQAASIIDGQHRLKGLEESGLSFDVAVTVFIGADDATEAYLFSKVNLAQTKVNRSLAYDLLALARERSPEKTCHEIAVALDAHVRSPFRGLIKRLGVATEGRVGETLSQATVVAGVLPYISNDPVGDRDRGKRFGFWEPIDPKDRSRRIFFEFFRTGQDSKILETLINYFSAIAEKWEPAWYSGERGVMINHTNGFNAFCRFLRPAYLALAHENDVPPKNQFREIFDRVELTARDFTVETFPPGTSGASLLYKTLLAQTEL